MRTATRIVRSSVKTLVLAVAVLTLPATAQAASVNPTLTTAATTYTGHPVQILCATNDADYATLLHSENAPDSADAFAEPSLDRAFFRTYDCQALTRWAQGRGDAEEEGELVEMFTHEATHLTGITDEGQTECAAVHNVWRMLKILNPHATAKRMKAAYHAAVEAHDSQTGEYRTVC